MVSHIGMLNCAVGMVVRVLQFKACGVAQGGGEGKVLGQGNRINSPSGGPVIGGSAPMAWYCSLLDFSARKRATDNLVSLIEQQGMIKLH